MNVQYIINKMAAKMHSQNLLRQKNEAAIATSILNKFTILGMPRSEKVA